MSDARDGKEYCRRRGFRARCDWQVKFLPRDYLKPFFFREKLEKNLHSVSPVVILPKSCK
jgi:hypothetical protein